MKPRVHPYARQDQRRQFEYLRKTNAGPATLQGFIDAVREAKKKIGDNPKTWNFAPGSKRVRRVQILNYRMQVYYVITPDEVPLILEIAGPGAEPRWHKRL